MTTFEETVPISAEAESATPQPVDLITMPDGSAVTTGETVISGIDRVILDGYRRSARLGAMTKEEAATGYRNWNHNSVLIPEDF